MCVCVCGMCVIFFPDCDKRYGCAVRGKARTQSGLKPWPFFLHMCFSVIMGTQISEHFLLSSNTVYEYIVVLYTYIGLYKQYIIYKHMVCVCACASVVCVCLCVRDSKAPINLSLGSAKRRSLCVGGHFTARTRRYTARRSAALIVRASRG